MDVICLSGGFCNKVIFSSSIVVQSGFEICVSRRSHVFNTQLIVTISAYNIHGGGWCWFW